MKKYIKLSVHQLVDFLLRKGDIDNRIYNQDAMNEGTRIHALYQSKQDENYIFEHALIDQIEVDDYIVTLEGRADGIIKNGINFIIDEIKSTLDDLENFHNDQEKWHLGQAKCYAYMYSKEISLNEIGIRLTYISQVNNEKKIFSYHYTRQELEDYIFSLIREYIDFLNLLETFKVNRNKIIKELKFPYTKFRPNQQKLAKYVYSVAKNGGTLFVEAPTGIGKTISTLYPYVKSLLLDSNEKIFYLTAKNSGKLSAEKAIFDMKLAGLEVKNITITAKEKICFCNGKSCNPDECPFAKNYYDKVRSVIIESMMNYSSFDQRAIENIASEHSICPFEFQLDLSLYMDIIICDYNYMFDPITHMQRYFDEDCSKYIALIDEVHNLVERGKSMYSASFTTKNFNAVRKDLRHFEHKKIKAELRKTNKELTLLEEELGNKEVLKITQDTIDKFVHRFELLLQVMREVDKNHHEVVTDSFIELSKELNKFVTIYEYIDNSYLFFARKNGEDLEININCLDASEKLHDSLRKVRAATLFSATLSPYDYYLRMLGGNEEESPLLKIPSPFSKKNLQTIVVPNVSIKYKNREGTYEYVADYIKKFVSTKVGNYLVFVPSYEYLCKIMTYIDIEDANIIVQEKEMKEIEKEEFISNFVPNPIKTTVGFVIIGGSFGEGIDLVDDRLIGVAIVGVGLPQICFEKDEERKYFCEENLNGFEYAYANPGINRVHQAVGRLIRTENDKGVALLIDDRYLTKPYLSIFESNLSNYEVVTNSDEIIKIINEFWSK